MWVGLALAYWIPSLPPGSAVILTALACYAVAAGWSRLRARRNAGTTRTAAGTTRTTVTIEL
jgi:hypothetical protein